MLITRAAKAMRFDIALLHLDPDSTVLIEPRGDAYIVRAFTADGGFGEYAIMQPEAYQQMLSWHSEAL